MKALNSVEGNNFMGTDFSEDTIFNQVQGGNVGYLISMHKALLYHSVRGYVQLVPVAIAIVT